MAEGDRLVNLPDSVPASHVPALTAAVLASKQGDIIEFGAGIGSTPLLHVLGKMLNRCVYSLENNADWLSDLSCFKASYHHLIHVEDWSKFEIQGGRWYGVAFVDCAPAEARADLILKLKGHACFIVAHDTDAAPEDKVGSYGWVKLEGVFQYQATWKHTRPWTTVFSDVMELSWLT